MRTYLTNAAYGVLDYAAYPIGMLVLAPIILRNMGAAAYGIWAVVTAAVSMGSIIASGFGDANIQHVASLRGLARHEALVRTVRCMIAINLVLGTALACIAWMLAPIAARHLVSSNAVLQQDCIWSLRIASLLLWLRTMESVCISTQRAFERYGAAVRISILARMLSLAVAAALTYAFHSVAGIVAAAALLNLIGTWLQFAKLRELLQAKSLMPAVDPNAMKALLGFGVFSWLQAVSGVVFSQADRLFLGVSLGAVAVASYALCTQLTQPIYGFAASGLHFLFPHLAARNASQAPSDVRRTVFLALGCNLLLVAVMTAALLLFGQRILRAWVGPEIARSATSIFPIILWSSALLALNVTGMYALLALGRVRIVTWINLTAGAAMLSLIFWLLPHAGAYGLALARLCYGAITLLLYVPLVRWLARARDGHLSLPAKPVCEEA
ncbi:MAG TPA: oligosaccharide flippase family protein [Acidobacteriaceae bacterium]